MRVRKVCSEREQRKLNVAAYARVSTLSEEQDESFDNNVLAEFLLKEQSCFL